MDDVTASTTVESLCGVASSQKPSRGSVATAGSAGGVAGAGAAYMPGSVPSPTSATAATVSVSGATGSAAPTSWLATMTRRVNRPVSVSGARGPSSRSLAAVSTLRVLVVDDEATHRRLCERMLLRLKCTVVCLEDGDELLPTLVAAGYTPTQPVVVPRLPLEEMASGGRPRHDRRDRRGSAGDTSVSEASASSAELLDVSAVKLASRPSRSDVSTEAPPPPFQPFDIVLLDIVMQRSYGVDVATDLMKRFVGASRRRPAITDGPSGGASDPRRLLPPVVAMTGNSSLEDCETYRRAGFSHVLSKPFDIVGLRATIDACVPPKK
jgi:CheY-like chemotaxis protein